MTTKNQNNAEAFAFAMQDRCGKFSIALSDVISCILIAEEKGYLPELPSEIKEQLIGMAKREEI